MKNFVLGACAAMAASFGAANAAVLDFTADVLSSAIGDVRTATVDNVLFTITGQPKAVNNSQRYDGGDQAFCDFLACERDGLGMKNDEFTGGEKPRERATIESEAIRVERIFLLDLFKSNNPDKGAESVQIRLYTADNLDSAAQTIVFDATDVKADNNAGYYALDVGLSNVVKMTFRARTRSGTDDRDSDFALAGVEFSEMPVPGAALFFGTAFLAGAAARRKRAA
ncbi:MAG: hypothetical protein AAFR65_14135 [Pseudomonadota bacterium]